MFVYKRKFLFSNTMSRLILNPETTFIGFVAFTFLQINKSSTQLKEKGWILSLSLFIYIHIYIYNLDEIKEKIRVPIQLMFYLEIPYHALFF